MRNNTKKIKDGTTQPYFVSKTKEGKKNFNSNRAIKIKLNSIIDLDVQEKRGKRHI